MSRNSFYSILKSFLHPCQKNIINGGVVEISREYFRIDESEISIVKDAHMPILFHNVTFKVKKNQRNCGVVIAFDQLQKLSYLIDLSEMELFCLCGSMVLDNKSPEEG